MSDRSKPIETRRKNRPQPMSLAQALRAHADAVFQMPTGEQFMGGRDVAFHSAMLAIAEWVESVEARLAEQEQEPQ